MEMSFGQACDYVGLKQTKRQARKFANRRGLAYRCGVQRLVSVPADVVQYKERRKIADDLMSRLQNHSS
jgi:hypothetical protein